MLSPSFGISEDDLTGLCTIEFKIVVFHQGLHIVEFGRSRCNTSLLAGTIGYVSAANLRKNYQK